MTNFLLCCYPTNHAICANLLVVRSVDVFIRDALPKVKKFY